jgi:hypothetical protein
MECYLVQNGGNPMNFKVVAYATEEELLAASPKENTIGIVTTDTITSWIFSATEPEAPVDGMVWISIGTSGAAEFNALKKNGIYIYPLSAKQYVSGAWVNVTAKIWQGGEWVGWATFVFNNGAFTSGSFGKRLGSSSCAVKIDSGELVIFGDGKTITRLWTENKYDTTGKNELVFVVSNMVNTDPNLTQLGTWHFGIGKQQDDDVFAAEVTVTGKNDASKTEYIVPLPPDGGLYYVKVSCIRSVWNTDEVYIPEIRLQ